MTRYFTTSQWTKLLSGLPPHGAILHLSSYRILTGLDEKATRQACWRLSRTGLLTHLGNGWYTHAFAKIQPAEVAAVLVQPSYVSLESVLSNSGVTTQSQHGLTCITLQPTQTRNTPVGEIAYRSIARQLFWGFEIQQSKNNLYVFHATPEKALLDLIYLSRKTGDRIWIDLDFSRLDETRLNEFAARFPHSVQNALQELRHSRVVVS